MKEYVTHPAELVYLAPSGISAEVASLAEPLSVAVHALRLAIFNPARKYWCTVLELLEYVLCLPLLNQCI